MAEESSSHGNLKRPFVEEDDESKRARFPKSRKTKHGDAVTDSPPGGGRGAVPSWKDARSAASIRALHRREIPPELIDEKTLGFLPDVRQAEVQYNEAFAEEGVALMEPFNLDREREDGYFDEYGNYIEYETNTCLIKDAWIDSVDFCETRAGETNNPMSVDEKPPEVAETKRRIADVLEPGETVLQGLRRLKGSTDKKQKMCAENKRLFDQLTEDAMKLVENGDYNVYDEKQESFALAGTRKRGRSDDMLGEDVASFEIRRTAYKKSSSGTCADNPSSVCESDYVYDESSGYYYSSSLGYYYDPNSGLYFCAASGQWETR